MTSFICCYSIDTQDIFDLKLSKFLDGRLFWVDLDAQPKLRQETETVIDNNDGSIFGWLCLILEQIIFELDIFLVLNSTARRSYVHISDIFYDPKWS